MTKSRPRPDNTARPASTARRDAASTTGTTGTTTKSLVAQRFAIAAIAIPVVATAVGLALQLSALGDLPDPIAINFGGNGEPGAFAPAWVSIALLAAIGLGIPLAMALSALSGLRLGGQGGFYRLTGTLAAGMSTFIAALSSALTLGQKGLADAKDADISPVALGVAIAITAVAAAVAWFIQPADAADHDRRQPVKPYDLAPGERAVWLSEASMSHRAIAMLGLAVVALWVGAGVAWVLSADPWTALLLAVVALVLTLAVFATAAFRVRIDAHGLTARSLAGVPRFGVPLDEIESVALVDVNPIAEFGGYGLRRVPGRFGVIVRSGQAISVQRRDGGLEFVITARDSATGAALLTALLENSSK
ncbi:MAG: DUF1648 domain-containing protein [Actinobacteria bacterium]|nr:DUF1648 domain-containing protein [Actinomycetota bacterium]